MWDGISPVRDSNSYDYNKILISRIISVPAIITNACRRSGSENDNQVSRIPSTLSVAAVDVVVACQPSPSHSILTLTPGRTRNIDQDMEALRLSRQDNPFLQVRIDKSLCCPFTNRPTTKTGKKENDFLKIQPLFINRDEERMKELWNNQMPVSKSCERCNYFLWGKSCLGLINGDSVISLKVERLVLEGSFTVLTIRFSLFSRFNQNSSDRWILMSSIRLKIWHSWNNDMANYDNF